MPRQPLALALGILCVAVGAGPAWAQAKHERPYFGRSLLWGSGMIVTPTAAVPPGRLNLSGTVGAYFPDTPGNALNEGGAATVGIYGLFEAGVSAYTDDRFAAFGKLQIVRGSTDFPALAVGVLNLTSQSLGRFGNEDPFYADFANRTVGYAVATYTVEPGEDDRPIWLQFSAGWGSGFLMESNPSFDQDLAGKGVFGSMALDFKIGRDHFLRLMAEYDSWNVNVGGMLMVGGAEISAGLLAIEDPTHPLVEGQTVLKELEENQLRPYVALTLDASVLKRWPLIWKPRGL